MRHYSRLSPEKSCILLPVLFFRALYDTVVDALFPVSAAERELLALSPEGALLALPKAPPYAGLTVPLKDVHSVLAYKDERVSRLVWNVKYKKDAHAVAIGGYVLWHELIRDTKNVEAKKIVLIPIPITKKRRRERGYNQCELLVDEIIHLDTDKQFTTDNGLLVRVQKTSDQKKKDRKERLVGAQGIFAVNKNMLDKKAPLVVIDDVITTGSTMKEAMDTLKAAGFEQVRGLSLAH